ncbi:MAG: hypothetical protein P4L36_15420 [Holophaga sp.]|nr:hypothetical protein [Holophaga sp.]
MVSPLGQRQMFQTINVEAVRAAAETSGLLQREATHKQVMADRMAEDQASVPEIPRTEAMRTEERKGGARDQGGRQGPGHGPGETADDQEAAPEGANPAEGHLDFLA